MNFVSPVWFWALLALPLMAALQWRAQRRRKKLLESFAAPALLRRLAPETRLWALLLREGTLLLALLFLVLALVRPQWGTVARNVQRQGLDLMLVVDASRSMQAQDIAPSRMVRARHEIGAFLEGAEGDRIGLIGFAAESRTLCPLTADYGAVRLFVDELDPDEFAQGTDIAGALRRAAASMPEQNSRFQIVVLVSDGEEHDEEALGVARQLAARGITLYSVGIGSTAGVPIPLSSEGGARYKTDARGEVVTTRLNENLLREIAEAGGGKYYHAGPDDFELRRVLDDIRDRERRAIDSDLYEQMVERYQIPLAVALFLLALELVLPSALAARRGRRAP